MTNTERGRNRELIPQGLVAQAGSTTTSARAAGEPDPFDLYIAYYLQCLRAGTCPTCEREIDFEQRGVNVFGSCGHRIGIGVALPVRRKRRIGAVMATRSAELERRPHPQRMMASGGAVAQKST